MAVYTVILLVVGIAVLGAVVLPRLLADKPMSFPILYVAGGALLFSLPLGLPNPDPVAHPGLAEHLTELVVIIALMGAGLKLDRPFDWRSWGSAWRLLLISMPITIGIVALAAWQLLDAHPATAVLLGAVVAPTDPVLASDVEASPPASDLDTDVDPEEQEGPIRFALTSEAGLNDGLAFPFTYLAIAMAASLGGGAADFGHFPVVGTKAWLGGLGWLVEWFLRDLLYRIVMGVVMGYVVGYATAKFIFGRPSSTELARVMEGAEALAATLLAYSVTELVHGYGFIAVFVAALVLRHFEWRHDYYRKLHDFAVIVERLLMAAVLVLFGGTLAAGLLSALTWRAVGLAVATILVVRPLAGLVGMLGSPVTWYEESVIASYGIRGIGSFYYLAFALNKATFKEIELLVAAEELWAFTGLVVIGSIIVHGITVSPVMNTLDRWRDEQEPETPPTMSEAD